MIDLGDSKVSHEGHDVKVWPLVICDSVTVEKKTRFLPEEVKRN